MQLIVKKVSKFINRSKIFTRKQELNIATAQYCLQKLRQEMAKNNIDDEWIIFNIDTDIFTFTTNKLEIHAQDMDNIADLISRDIAKQLPNLALNEENGKMLEDVSLSIYDEMATGEIQESTHKERSINIFDKFKQNLLNRSFLAGAPLAGVPFRRQEENLDEKPSYQNDWDSEQPSKSSTQSYPEIPDNQTVNTDNIQYADTDTESISVENVAVSPQFEHVDEKDNAAKFISIDDKYTKEKEIDQLDESSLPNRNHLIELYRKQILKSDDLLKMLQLNEKNLSDMDKKRLNYLLSNQDKMQNMMEGLTNSLVYIIQKMENDLRSSIEEKREAILSQRVLDNIVRKPLEAYQKVLDEELSKSIQDSMNLLERQFEKEKTQMERAHQRALKDLELRFDNEKDIQTSRLNKEGTQANHSRLETYHQELINQEKVQRSRELQNFINEKNIDFYNTLKEEVDKLKENRDQFFQKMYAEMESLKPVWEREISEEKLAKSEEINAQHKRMVAELQDTISELKAVQKDVEQANDEISYREQMRQAFERDMRQKELEWQAISEKREQMMQLLEVERENLQKEKEQFHLEKGQNQISNEPVEDIKSKNWYQKWQIWISVLATCFVFGGAVFAMNQALNYQAQQEKNEQIQAHKQSIEKLEKKLEQLEDKQTNSTADAQVQAFNEALANNTKDEVIRTYEALNPTQQSRLTADEIYQVGQAYLAKNMVDKAKQLPRKSSSLNTLIDSFNTLQKKITEAEKVQDNNQKETLEQTRNDLLGVLNNEGKG